MRSNRMTVMLAGVAVLALGACSREDEGANDQGEAETAEAASEAGAGAGPAATMSSPFMAAEQQMNARMTAAVGASAEHTWAAKMREHHRGAVEMTEPHLAQFQDAELRQIAQRTVEMQRKEIGELEKWLQGHGEASGSVNPFAEGEKRMHERMMAANGPDLQQTWARKMIEHHRGAIGMSETVLADAKDADIRRMAQKTVNDQQKEIQELERWLQAHSG